MNKKRHHYIPRAYLKAFEDDEGKVRIYMRDEPDRLIHQSPDSLGFHKYYYSQPLPGGGKDHNTMEGLFGELECRWPPIVESLRQGEDVNDRLGDILAFISLQRARVPAARDACEAILAESIKSTARALDAAGMFPPKPKGFEDILDYVDVSIDLHQSIHAMVQIIEATGWILDRIGIGALRNETDIPFLTSDNPVIWFDASVPTPEIQPYQVHPGGLIVLAFPVASDLLFYGHTSMRQQFSQQGLAYSALAEPDVAELFNELVCRFAYRAVFAQQAGMEDLIRVHALLSPVVAVEKIKINGKEAQRFRMVFGSRVRKVKWRGPARTRTKSSPR